MSYNSPKFTLIDDLPELEELESGMRGGHGHPPGMGHPSGMRGGPSPGEINRPSMINTGKYLKNNKREISSLSGMGPEDPRMRGWKPGMMGGDGDGYDVGGFTPADNNFITYDMPSGSPTCIDVAEHIANCPICSKFYNNDKTVYLLAIAALVIICILLANKCLHSK